jgi:glucose/mannose-6-phosphate isomerase
MMVDRVSLDDPAAIDAADPGGMLRAVSGLGRQLRRGFDVGRKASGSTEGDHAAVVVCGLGGSGIAGDVVRSLLGPRSPVPIVVAKGEALPAFCGPGTLVIAVSYSGNTEEAISSYQEAVRRGCAVVAVSAGGRLRDEAARVAQIHLAIPDDAGMPRAALGYLAGAVLGWLDRDGALGLGPEVEAGAGRLEAMVQRWLPSEPVAGNPAKSLAAWLLGRTPVVWGSEGLMEAAAIRFKNQLNENAKVPAFYSFLPEAGHNEIEGWSAGLGSGFGLVALRHDGERPRMAERFDASLDAVAASGLESRQVRVEGDGDLERLLGTILLTDFASVYLGILRGVDPTPIPAITSLKKPPSR